MKKILILASLLISSGAMAHEVIHVDHADTHKAGDGHIAINHDGHVDHLHDGHLHNIHDGHVDEHVITASAENPMAEELVKQVKDGDHKHDASDNAHPRIQHDDHFDYLHDGRLHFVHANHVDDHGKVQIIK